MAEHHSRIQYKSIALGLLFLLLSLLFFVPAYADFGTGQYTALNGISAEYMLRSAEEAVFTRQFESGLEMLRDLNGYSDSAELAEYVSSYIRTEPYYDSPVLADKYIRCAYSCGKVYSLTDYGAANNDYDRYKGLVYVPDIVDETTAFVQYFCGGGSGEDCLWYPGVDEYFTRYAPNAIIVFTTESGSTRMQERISWQWDVLRHIAYDCGIIVHDLSAVGSSNGAYTAMMLAYSFYSDYGLKTERVLTLDTGMCWELSDLYLSETQLRTVAEEETTLYTFEAGDFLQDDIHSDYLQSILASGVELIPVICESGGHSVISENAYFYGLFSFAAGESIYLPPAEYTPVDLYAE